MPTKIVPSDIEIAQQAKMLPIGKVAERLHIPAEDLCQYGPFKAKVSLDFYQRQQNAKPGKLILVTAITPTPAGSSGDASWT